MVGVSDTAPESASPTRARRDTALWVLAAMAVAYGLAQ